MSPASNLETEGLLSEIRWLRVVLLVFPLWECVCESLPRSVMFSVIYCHPVFIVVYFVTVASSQKETPTKAGEPV